MDCASGGVAGLLQSGCDQVPLSGRVALQVEEVGREVYSIGDVEAAAVILSGLAGGAILALVVGGILSALRLKLDETLSMFLAQGQLRFDPDPLQIALALAFMLFAGLLAAWRPAHHAADLLPADALRHRA